MTISDPQAYAQQWIAEWNARDLDAVLIHYADDVVFRSPIAVRVRPETGGVVVGKAALADYWTAALAQVPDLEFTLEGVFETVGGVTILYRNQRGQRVAESLFVNDAGLVELGCGSYEMPS